MDRKEQIKLCKRFLRDLKKTKDYYFLCMSTTVKERKIVNLLGNYGNKHIKNFDWDLVFYYHRNPNVTAKKYNKAKRKHIKKYLKYLKS